MSEKTIKKSIFAKLRNNFIAGIVVLIPIGITLYLTLFIIKFSGNIIPKEINPNNYLPFDIPGLEILIAIIIITFFGWLSLSFLGKKFFEIFNNVLKRIIIVSKYGIYYLFLRDYNEIIYLYNKYSFIIKLKTLGKDYFIRNNDDLIMIYKPKLHELFKNTILDINLPNKKQLLVDVYDLKSKEFIIVKDKGFNNGRLIIIKNIKNLY